MPIYTTGPLLVHDSSLGVGKDAFPKASLSLDTWWTKYYKLAVRDPLNMTLSAWLKNRLSGNLSKLK